MEKNVTTIGKNIRDRINNEKYIKHSREIRTLLFCKNLENKVLELN